MITLLLIALVATAAPASSPDEAARLFQLGNALYAEGDAAGAVTAYWAAVDSGWESVELYLNLAVAATRAGEAGAARLAAERALRMAPADEAVTRDVQRIRDAVTGGEAAQSRTTGPFAGQEGWLLFGAVALWGVALLALAVGVWTRRRRLRTGGGVAAACALVAVAVATWASVEAARPAIVVMAPTADMHAGPDRSASVVDALQAGSLVTVERRDGRWLRVRAEDGTRGWIQGEFALDV